MSKNIKEMDDESKAITWRSIICHFSRNGHNSLMNCQNQVWRDSERVPALKLSHSVFGAEFFLGVGFEFQL